jgi:hypothetical protein
MGSWISPKLGRADRFFQLGRESISLLAAACADVLGFQNCREAGGTMVIWEMNGSTISIADFASVRANQFETWHLFRVQRVAPCSSYHLEVPCWRQRFFPGAAVRRLHARRPRMGNSERGADQFPGKLPLG